MATLNIPPLKPATFRWHPSPADSLTTQRLAIGTEQWVGIKHTNVKGQYDNYVNTTLQLDVAGLSLTRLSTQLTAALVHLRFSHPEVASTAVWEDGKPTPPLIQYTPPADGAAALRWARTCIYVRTTPLNGLAVRAELERERRAAAPESKRSVSVFVIGDAASEETPLAQGSKIDLLCRFNHIFRDAMNSWQFVGDLLQRIGDMWDPDTDSPVAEYNWGEEVANLSKPILDALKVDVEALGDDFNKARDEFITSLIKSGVSLPSFFTPAPPHPAQYLTTNTAVQLGPHRRQRGRDPPHRIPPLQPRRKRSHHPRRQISPGAAVHHLPPGPRGDGPRSPQSEAVACRCPGRHAARHAPARQRPALSTGRVYAHAAQGLPGGRGGRVPAPQVVGRGRVRYRRCHCTRRRCWNADVDTSRRGMITG